MARRNRQLGIALALAVGGVALAQPAAAQFRDFFRFPFGERGGSQANPFNPWSQPRPQTFEATKPPPPRKLETPPSQTILVVGDSMADWLGYGLEEAFTDTPEIGIVRKIRPYSGLVRYEARADAPEWSQAIKDVLASEKPSAIVVMLGLNDRLPLRERAPAKNAATSPQGQAATAAKGAAASPQGQGAPAPAAASPTAAAAAAESPPADTEQPAIAAPEKERRGPGASYEFRSDKWAELYDKRIDDMIAALKSKSVPVLWVGLPAIRGTRSTSDISYLDELYRARAEKAGITYVDIWDGFVDEQGRYVVQGPDFEGQTRRLRTYDGVHFTKAGAEKLAMYVEHELRRVMINHVAPVALPGPEEQTPAKGNAVGTRPAIGPVVPLSAISGESGDLLGATNHPAQRESDPIATRVLSHGDAIAAPSGRADDFSWPRAGANADSAIDAAPAPAAAAPPAPKGGAVKGNANKIDTNKNADAKRSSDAKNPPAPAAAVKPRNTRAELDGAPPRPPLPVGAGRD